MYHFLGFLYFKPINITYIVKELQHEPEEVKFKTI